MVTVNNAINNTIGGSNSGVTNTLTVTNSSNTASSQAQELIVVGGSSSGDAFTTYTVTGATSWSQGIDNSALDSFVLSASTALGTTNVLSFATGGDATYPLGNISVTRSASGSDVALTLSNTSNTASSTTSQYLQVGGASAGDAQTQYLVNGATTWTQGIDNSASDAFVLAASSTLGTTNVMSAATGGAVSFPLGNIDITKSASGADVSLTISNTSNTASSSATEYLTVAGTSAGDAQIQYAISGTTTWTQGIDNSANDTFVLSASNALGTTNVISASTTGTVSFVAGSVDVTKSDSGVGVSITASNTSNTASSSATLYATVAGSTANDARTQYAVTGVTTWTEGIDNSASDAFVIAASNNLGTTNVMSASVAGEVNFPLQPAFLAYVNTTITNVTGDGTVYTIIFDTEVYDQNADFAIGTSIFTAPVTGIYDLTLCIRLLGGTSIIPANASIATSNRIYTESMALSAQVTTSANITMNVRADMDAADTATFTVVTTDSGGKIDDVGGLASSEVRTWVCGNLVA